MENTTTKTQELPLWQAPVITELEIKKTMNASGTSTDGVISQSP